MIGIEWSNAGLAGAFLLGAVFASIVVLRLARVIAEFLGEISKKEKQHDDGSDR